MSKDYKQVKVSANENVKSPSGPLGNNKTVYSELKLSEILLQDIDTYKQLIWQRNENLDKKDQVSQKL